MEEYENISVLCKNFQVIHQSSISLKDGSISDLSSPLSLWQSSRWYSGNQTSIATSWSLRFIQQQLLLCLINGKIKYHFLMQSVQGMLKQYSSCSIMLSSNTLLLVISHLSGLAVSSGIKIWSQRPFKAQIPIEYRTKESLCYTVQLVPAIAACKPRTFQTPQFSMLQMERRKQHMC